MRGALTLPSAPAKVARLGSRFRYSFMEGNMKTKRAPFLRYFSGLSLLLTAGLMAANLGDWSAPVNLGATINTTSGEL